MAAKKKQVKDVVVKLRMTSADRETWQRAADADARSLGDWIRARCAGLPTTAPIASKRGAR